MSRDLLLEETGDDRITESGDVVVLETSSTDSDGEIKSESAVDTDWLLLEGGGSGTAIWRGGPMVGMPGNGGDLATVDYEWFYNYTPTSGYSTSVPFVPMVFNAADVSSAPSGTSDEYLLTFNEPDAAGANHLTPDEALSYWPALMATGRQLSFPATKDGSTTWRSDFWTGAQAAGYRVDFMAIHWYGDFTPAANLRNFLNTVYANFGLPIWLTEFSAYNGTLAENTTFIQNVGPLLAALPYLQRVGWFANRSIGGAYANSGLVDGSGALTTVGTAYKAVSSPIVDTSDALLTEGAVVGAGYVDPVAGPSGLWLPPGSGFEEAVRKSHTLMTKVEVLSGGAVIGTIEPIEGSVTLDATAEFRGSFSCTVVDDGTLGLIPIDGNSLLMPYGNELRVWRGILMSDGSVQGVSLGVFRIESATTEDSLDGLHIQVEASDRASRVADAVFEADTTQGGQDPGDPTAAEVIKNLISPLVPEAQFIGFDDLSDYKIPAVAVNRGDDPWALATGIAIALGGELYFDGDGDCVLRKAPSSAGEPKVVVSEGEVLMRAAKDNTRDGVYNRVIVVADDANIDPGIATDTTSPTAYDTRFGRVPYIVEIGQFITTPEQAQDAAQGILQAFMGARVQIDFDMLPDPRLVPSDVVRVVRGRMGINESYVIDSITYPLGPDGITTAATRRAEENTEAVTG